VCCKKDASRNLSKCFESISKFQNFLNICSCWARLKETNQFEKSEYSEETVQSWNSCQSQNFRISSFNTLCCVQFLKNLERNCCKKINKEPAFKIILCNCRLMNFKYSSCSFSCSKESKYNIYEKTKVNPQIKDELLISWFILKTNFEGNKYSSVQK